MSKEHENEFGVTLICSKCGACACKECSQEGNGQCRFCHRPLKRIPKADFK